MSEIRREEYWLTRDATGVRTLWEAEEPPTYDDEEGFWGGNDWRHKIVASDDEEYEYASVTCFLGTKKCFGIRKAGMKKLILKTIVTKEIEVL
jgi:hypothetical protein